MRGEVPGEDYSVSVRGGFVVKGAAGGGLWIANLRLHEMSRFKIRF